MVSLVFIMAIPMGTLADKVGRKKVLATSILGPLLSTGWMLLIGAYPRPHPGNILD